MKHLRLPEGQLILVPDDAVIGHRRAGWEITDPPEPDPPVSDLNAAAIGDSPDSDSEPDTDAAAVTRPDESTPAQDGKE